MVNVYGCHFAPYMTRLISLFNTKLFLAETGFKIGFPRISEAPLDTD